MAVGQHGERDALRAQVRGLQAALAEAEERGRAVKAAAERLHRQAQDSYAQATDAFHRGREVVDSARAVQDAAHAAVQDAQRRQMEAEDRARLAGQAADAAQADRDAVLGSTVWRATAPVRAVFSRLRPARPGLVGATPPDRPDLEPAASAAPELPVTEPVAAEPPPPPEPPPAVGVPGWPGPEEKARVLALATAELQVFLAGTERIVFAPTAEPEVSVVVLLWNSAALTLRCLRAVRDQADVRVQLVLWDNGSTDETAALLARVDGARVIRRGENAGFVRGCNGAVAATDASAVLLLNSDVVLRPGAVAAALDTLGAGPEVGAVGARLVLSDGTLQEAGSILWADAVAEGVGRGEPADGAVATTRREVDYCSAAFLLLRRDTWDALGGFDERFSPAYYEEVDLCLRLRARGLRVMYEPRAVVDHFEFGSGGAAAMQDLSVRNRTLLRTLHADALHIRHLPRHPANRPYAQARLRPGQRRLLIIDDLPPLVATGAGYPRARAVLAEAVAAGWAVTLFASARPEIADWAALRAEVPWEVEVVTGGAAPELGAFLLNRDGFYEAMWVSRPGNMAAVRAVAAVHAHLLWGVRLIYDAEAVFTERDALHATLLGRALAADEVEARLTRELSLADGADAVACVSPADAALFRARAPVHVLAHAGVARRDTPGFAVRSGLLFVGPLSIEVSPNRDGVAWFLREVWPLVRARLPDATLTLVGQLPPDPVPGFGAPGVIAAGAQGDLGPFYDRARVFVAPVRWAAGLPLKIVEASLAGVPCAGSALMARLMGWEPGREMEAADDPAELARAVVALHEDEATWTGVRGRALADAAPRFAPEVFRQTVRALLDDPDVSRETSLSP